MKTINALAKHLASLEGKKSQARIHDIRELLSLLSDLIYQKDTVLIDGSDALWVLWDNGHRRARRKKK